MACFCEPTKFLAFRVILKAVAARPWHRVLAFLWYAFCVTVSVWLMHRNVERDTRAANTVELSRQQDENAAAAIFEQQERRLRTELKEAQAAEEEALRAIVPGIEGIDALKAKLPQAPSLALRRAIDRDLAQAVLNAQHQARAQRAHVKVSETIVAIERLTAGRPRSTTGRPVITSAQVARSAPVNIVHSITSVQLNLSKLDIQTFVGALVVELMIIGGVWTDVLMHRQPKPAPTPSVVPEGLLPAHASTLEKFLRREWAKHRDKEGWLTGTQRAWARATNSTQGFVHAQLERLAKSNVIEKQTSARHTRIKFRKTGELKIVE